MLLLHEFAIIKDIKFTYYLTLSGRGITEDLKEGIEAYKAIKKDLKLLKFYRGWFCKSRNQDSIFIDLVKVYEQYGVNTANQFHHEISKYISKYPTTTCRSVLATTKFIFEAICKSFKTLDDLGNLKNPLFVNQFVEYLFSLHILNSRLKGTSALNSYKSWGNIIQIIRDVFIHYGLFSEPEYELFSPLFKTSRSISATNLKKDDSGNIFSSKLITSISLSLKDEEAIEMLLAQIKSDINFVSSACKSEAKRIMKNNNDRKELAKIGKAIPQGLGKGVNHKVDVYDFNNKCATWEAYNFELVSHDTKRCLYGVN